MTKLHLKQTGFTQLRHRLRRVKVVSPLRLRSGISSAFTIVELLVVIVVIGILAAITIVSYTGITSRAAKATLQSDLKNASTQLSIDNVTNGSYPESEATANSGKGLPKSSGTVYTYTQTDTSYCLSATSAQAGSSTFNISSTTGVIEEGGCPASSFAVAWSGEVSDMGYSIIQTNDGGYAVTGKTDSYSDDFYEIFLAKYDSSGVLSWSRVWGGNEGPEDFGNSLVQTNDGGYAVTGWIDGDMFLAKFDSIGNLSWNRNWAGGGYDTGRSLVQTNDGGYVITGSENYGDSLLLAKFDSIGNLSWNRLWGGNEYDNGISIVQTSDGGYAVTGSTASYGAGNDDMLIAKFDSSGNMAWIKTWGGIRVDCGTSIVQTDDDGYAVTGYTFSFSSSEGKEDIFIVKYDSSGNLIWNITWGGLEVDRANSLVQTSDGGYAVAGSTESYGTGYSDMFILKYDSTGNLIWNRTLGGYSWDNAYSLVHTSDDGFALTGESDWNNLGGMDMILTKLTYEGLLAGCSEPMCQTPVGAIVSNPTATITSPSNTVSTPIATVTNPTYNVASPSVASTVLVAPY